MKHLWSIKVNSLVYGIPRKYLGKAEDQIQSSVCSSLKQSFLLFLLSYLETIYVKEALSPWEQFSQHMVIALGCLSFSW